MTRPHPIRVINVKALRLMYKVDSTSPTWLRSLKTGKTAGLVRADGRVRVSIRINGKNHHIMGSRLVWALTHDKDIPEGMFIDHIDGDVSNDDPNNLKTVTHKENMQNCKVRVNNTSGIAGVTVKGRKWLARVKPLNGPRLELGYFDTKEEAGEAVRKWRLEQGLPIQRPRYRKTKVVLLVHNEATLLRAIATLKELPVPYNITITKKE